MTIKRCPFCGCQLQQENRWVEAKRDELPFQTFYVHPANRCILQKFEIRSRNIAQWNGRVNEKD